MVDLWWYGQSCFKVKGKNVSLVFDPYDPSFIGLKNLKLEGDIVCVSHEHKDHSNIDAVKGMGESSPFVIFGPGEYEKLGVNIVGIPSWHDNKEGAERGKNVIYHVKIDDVNIVHLGDLGQKKLSPEQVEALSTCDVLLIPVGSVYTISGKDAPDIISQIEPKVIVPMHYKIEGLKIELESVSVFLEAMGKEAIESAPKLSVSAQSLPVEPEVAVLKAQI